MGGFKKNLIDIPLRDVALQRREGTLQGAFSQLSTDLFSRLYDLRRRILHGDELAYFESLKFDRRRKSYLLGRTAAKCALGRLLEEPEWSRIQVLPGVFQQPVVVHDGRIPLGVSISHTDEVACAIAFPEVHPMAVDVEMVREERIAVMATQMTGREIAMAGERSSAPHRQALHYALLWSAKEALSKVLRCGLAVPFQLLEVERFSVEALNAVRIEPAGSTIAWTAAWSGSFTHFSQYKFFSWSDGGIVMSLVLPVHTILLPGCCR